MVPVLWWVVVGAVAAFGVAALLSIGVFVLPVALVLAGAGLWSRRLRTGTLPGLLMGALRFGHLPTILIPGGPMPTGLPNKAKAAVRERYAEGLAQREELLEAEIGAYHSKGTCTFYGTANTNQMMMEVMGLHMPGAAFVNPGTKLRQQLTRREGRANVALADFIAPRASGLADHIGAFMVTAGIGEDDVAERFKQANDDYSVLSKTSVDPAS